MKKIFFYFVLLTAAVIATASCSKEEPAQTETTQTGMVLHATVDQTAATRATLSDGDTWTFAFSQNDVVFVRNDEMSHDKHWMFTKGAGDFTCPSAETTKSATDWYAYFPQVIVYLFQQSGKKEDVANLYALSGTTAGPTTGEDGLSIAMAPQVAILVIENKIGPIDINVKTGPNSWVHSLKAKTGTAGFDLVTEETKVSLLTTETPGLYYIAVPAGVQLCIKNGDTEIRTTKEAGFTAGKYYELKVAPTTGTATRKGDIDVKWVQLWAGGPKFAEYDVEGKMTFYDAAKTGDEYVWGANWRTPSKDEMEELAKAASIFGQSSKVNCDYNVGAIGFKFTGKESGYTENSVFLPATRLDAFIGIAEYWSSTADGNYGWYMSICHYMESEWRSENPLGEYLVRPVLAE